jgi:hypothetical protein
MPAANDAASYQRIPRFTPALDQILQTPTAYTSVDARSSEIV